MESVLAEFCRSYYKLTSELRPDLQNPLEIRQEEFHKIPGGGGGEYDERNTGLGGELAQGISGHR
jgi:hypothetical protein